MGKTKPKSFVISKESVWRAYQRVKANRGGCGVDKMSLKDFEDNLQDNLYKLCVQKDCIIMPCAIGSLDYYRVRII